MSRCALRLEDRQLEKPIITEQLTEAKPNHESTSLEVDFKVLQAQNQRNIQGELNFFSLDVEMFSDGIIIEQLNGNITYVNEVMLKIYGNNDK